MTDALASFIASPAPWNIALSTGWPPAPSLGSAILEDQYTSYAFGQQTPILPGTLYEYWSKESAIPAIQQMAYDHLSIPVMSSEIERAFSGAKLNLPASRNQLRPDILEAQECVRRWLNAGL
jgi:hypothetical protein